MSRPNSSASSIRAICGSPTSVAATATRTKCCEIRKSMMTHGCMLWGAALYNNGSVPSKQPPLWRKLQHERACRSESKPCRRRREREMVEKGVAAVSRSAAALRDHASRRTSCGSSSAAADFEPETGIPERLEESGRPRHRLSTRGLGTENRTDPVFISLQKTRLLDPTLNFLGTNDHPGDYRSSGCTRLPRDLRQRSLARPLRALCPVRQSRDCPSIPIRRFRKNEPGHPIRHEFARGGGIPTSQCMVCHIHPGTTVMNSYIGYHWWDEETDGDLMYPAQQKHPTAEQVRPGRRCRIPTKRPAAGCGPIPNSWRI